MNFAVAGGKTSRPETPGKIAIVGSGWGMGGLGCHGQNGAPERNTLHNVEEIKKGLAKFDWLK